MGPHVFKRTVQSLNKSNLKYLTKALAIAFGLRTYLKRRLLVQRLDLSNNEAEVLQNLKTKGYSEIDLDPHGLEELEKYAVDKIRRAEQIKLQSAAMTKDFLIRLSDEDIVGQNLTTQNPMVSLTLAESLLKLAACYLQSAPFLAYVITTLSIYRGDEPKSSQLWHKDYDDTRLLKLFIYLTDVNSPADGPFTFVEAVNSDKVKNSFFNRHLNDVEFKQQVADANLVQMVKPKLTCFLVDTSRCYHMGSRLARGHQRLMLTALYICPPSNYPNGAIERIEVEPGFQPSVLQRAALRI